MTKVLLLLLLPALAFSQQKGDNTIIVYAGSYSACLRAAVDSGYTVDTHDDSSHYFSTKPAGMKGNSSTHIFNVRVKDSIAYITGTWDPHISTGGLFRASYTQEPIMIKGWKTGGYIPNFNLMDKFAKCLGSVVTYKQLEDK